MPSCAPEGLARPVSRWLLIFDIALAASITVVWLGLFEVRRVPLVVLVHGLAFVLRMLVWLFYRRRALQEIADLCERSESTDQQLSAADEALRRFPMQHALVYAGSWTGYFAVAMGVSVLASVLIVGRGELLAAGLLALGTSIAVFAPGMLGAQLELDASQLHVRATLEQRGVSTMVVPSVLATRFVMLSTSVVVGSVLIMTALGWRAELDAARQAAVNTARMRVTQELLAFDGTRAPTQGVVLTDQRPPELAQIEATDRADHVLVEIDIRRELVLAAAPLVDGHWLLLHQPIGLDRPAFWRGISFALLAIFGVVAFGFTMQIRSMLAPVERVRSTLARIVEDGDLQSIDKLTILRDDELGYLTRDLNRLLDGLGLLATNARAAADGQPLEAVEPRGELARALHAMIERVRTIVAQSHEVVASLSATATALRSTAQIQDQVHEQQSTSVRNIGENMASLESSAAQIAAAIVEVSDNAESTLAATDELADGIAQLDAHTQGIRELLEIIREVAARSDILALNGALEATRVGDAGRGFALIADEMRRLAVRVTKTAGDVRRLVVDIADGSENNVDLTELGRTLAEGTTNAAREIASATYRQTSETEQVHNRVRELAEFIGQTTAATVQTRLIADDLQQRAERLDAQIRRLER